MQRRRFHAISDAVGVGTATILTAAIDESNGVNIHGLRLGFICEPETGDANANGMWALWCLPDEVTGAPSTVTATMELEGSNAFLWACGVWAASNQTPYCLPETALGTSRNCQQGARLVLTVHKEGVSAGNVRVRSFMTFHTKSL